MTETKQDESDKLENGLFEEETFIWQAALAIAQGTAARGGVHAGGSMIHQSPKEFGADCVARAMSLWDAYVLAIEGGPF